MNKIKNGDGESAAQQIQALTATFKDRGISFRHFPLSRCEELRWQAGRTVLDNIDMPDGTILPLERFELVEWGASAGQLLERLAAHG